MKVRRQWITYQLSKHQWRVRLLGIPRHSIFNTTDAGNVASVMIIICICVNLSCYDFQWYVWGFSELYNDVSHTGYYPLFGNFIILWTAEIFFVISELIILWGTWELFKVWLCYVVIIFVFFSVSVSYGFTMIWYWADLSWTHRLERYNKCCNTLLACGLP